MNKKSLFVDIISRGWNSLLDLFYPRVCLSCKSTLKDKEELLCQNCIDNLPRTHMGDSVDNPVKIIFWDVQKLVHAHSFCNYKNEDFRALVHLLKYSNKPYIGKYLATIAAKELLPIGFFADIDIIAPVPLHKNRLKQRGYNQSLYIALGLSEVSGIEVDDSHLYRVKDNPSQTAKNSEERLLNTQDIFAIKQPENWRGKHILLVDDVITTGATLRSLMSQITPIRGTKISVFSLALAGVRMTETEIVY